MNYDAAVTDWLRLHRLEPPLEEHPDWGIKFTLSTAPHADWMTRRSKVAPDALWFGASVHRMGGWRALVMNRDRTLDVNWSGTRALNVVAGTFLQRNRTAWPMLESPDELPNLVPGIEAILEKRFIRHAEVDAHSLKSQDLETLRRWLLPVCDTIDFQLGALHGALPTNVDCEDRRAERMGIDIRISAEVSLSFAVGT